MSEPTAIWARVSTSDQHAENQLTVLRAWAAQLGLEVVQEFVTEDSAWQAGTGNARGAEFERQRAALLEGAQRGRYQVVLVWAIDRLSRKGSEDMQRFIRRLAEAGADLRSQQESWLNTADPMTRELLIGIFATIARHDSQRRSERIKVGLDRRKAAGLPVGRQPGAGDTKPRRRSGYYARWERERAERERSQDQR